MKTKVMIVLLLLCGGLLACEAEQADHYYGSVEYTVRGTDLEQRAFLLAESAELCEENNRDFIVGVRQSCTSCHIEASSCSTSLPHTYREIFDDVPGPAPYVSAPEFRLVISGIGLTEARTLCHEIAEVWAQGMEQPASCIVDEE